MQLVKRFSTHEENLFLFWSAFLFYMKLEYTEYIRIYVYMGDILGE